jgi:hypothetical protein
MSPHCKMVNGTPIASTTCNRNSAADSPHCGVISSLFQVETAPDFQNSGDAVLCGGSLAGSANSIKCEAANFLCRVTDLNCAYFLAGYTSRSSKASMPSAAVRVPDNLNADMDTRE